MTVGTAYSFTPSVITSYSIHYTKLYDDFDRLVLIAAPRFLGVLRRSLSGPTRAMVSHEVAKDLVHEPAEAVRKWLRP